MDKKSVKFHLSDKGPAPCRAEVRNCPVGGQHFENFQEAKSTYEELNGSKNIKVNKKFTQIDLNGWEWSETFKRAPTYEKKDLVEARPSSKGEKLVTHLKNGSVETSRTLEGNEMIVTNPSGEEYAMSLDKFSERYEKLPNGKYKSLGKIKAIPNPTGKSIKIMAPWGEEQLGDENCMIADNGADRYIIGGEEFNETYQMANGEGIKSKIIGGKITSFANGRYYGIHVNNNDVYEALEDFKSHVGVDDFNSMRKFKRQRDRGEVYHLTVVSPNEMKKLPKDIAIPENVKIKYNGVGKAVDGNNEAYFIACESEEVNEWRLKNNLPPKDLHITLGFKNNDVHNKSKGLDSLI